MPNQDPGRRVLFRYPVAWSGWILTEFHVATDETGRCRFVLPLGDDVPDDLLPKLDRQDLAELNNPPPSGS